MTTLPPFPEENEDPWNDKIQAWAAEVKSLLEGPSSPETIQAYFSSTLKLAMFEGIGDLLVGSEADGGAAAILPRGLDGQILQVNTLQPLGLEWSDRLTQAQSAAQDAINLATQTAIEAVRSVITEYAVNSSETVAPTTGWSTDQPIRTPGTYIWYRTITTKGPIEEEEVITSAPALLTGNTGSQGIPGEQGPQGEQGDQGPQGIPGTPGADGTPRYMWLKYADSPTTGMSDSPTGKSYIGVAYNKTTATESSTYSDYEWSLIKGPQGDQGNQGIQGPPGEDGQPTYTWIKYGTSSAGAGLSDDPTGRAYIGIAYNKTTPVESTTPGDYTWSLIQGPQGVQGDPGAPGAAGKGISSATIRYQVSSSGTVTPTGTWTTSPGATSPGEFLWTRTVLTFTDSTTATAYSVAAHGSTGATGATGSTGATGAAGVSISSITPYFLQVGAGSSTPAKPVTNPPGGSWSLTEPGYTTSTELYRTELIVFSNATFAYTNVSKVSSYTAATQAVTAANLADAAAKGLIKASVTDPGHAVGRLWMVLNGSGDTIGIKISNGSAWSSYALMADQILVPGSVGPTQIANGAITTVKLDATAINGMTITGATVQTTATSSRGVKIDSSGLKAYNNSGVLTLDINGSTGAITITGTINASAGTFSGNITLTGTITASGATSASPGFYVLDTTSNMRSALRPRGLEFHDPSGSTQTIRINTTKISTGDPLVPGIIAMQFRNSDDNIVMEVSKYLFGSHQFGLKLDRGVKIGYGPPILDYDGFNGHFFLRSGLSSTYAIKGFHIGADPAGLPPASASNVTLGDVAFTNYNAAPGREPGLGLYAYRPNSPVGWELVDLFIKPVFKINSIGRSNQSIPNATWTLMNSIFGSTPEINRGFTSWSSGVLTIKEPGIYYLGCRMAMTSGGSVGSVRVRIMLNTSATPTNWTDVILDTPEYQSHSVEGSGLFQFAAGDTIRMWAFQASGVTRSIEGGIPSNYLNLIWLAPVGP